MRAETIWPYLQCLTGFGSSDASKKSLQKMPQEIEITADSGGNDMTYV